MKNNITSVCSHAFRIICTLFGILLSLASLTEATAMYKQGVFYQAGYAIASIGLAFGVICLGVLVSYLVDKELSRDLDL